MIESPLTGLRKLFNTSYTSNMEGKDGERETETPEEESFWSSNMRLLSNHANILRPIPVARGLGYADWIELGWLGN